MYLFIFFFFLLFIWAQLQFNLRIFGVYLSFCLFYAPVFFQFSLLLSLVFVRNELVEFFTWKLYDFRFFCRIDELIVRMNCFGKLWEVRFVRFPVLKFQTVMPLQFCASKFFSRIFSQLSWYSNFSQGGRSGNAQKWENLPLIFYGFHDGHWLIFVSYIRDVEFDVKVGLKIF